MINVPNISMNQNSFKYYGLQDGGFKRGMNTIPFRGNGFQLCQNAKINNGIVSKMTGDTLVYDFGDDSRIIAVHEFQKPDGSFQTLCFVRTGLVVKLRAVEDDGTVTVPIGGAGDVDFIDDTISYEQIAQTGYVISKSKTLFYSWNGTQLTVMIGTTSNVLSASKEGRRLNFLANGIAFFSGSDANPITDVYTGSSSQNHGEYTPNISGYPVGIYSGSTGTIISFTSGFELHNIVEYDEGSGLRGDTRDKSFQYRGDGIEKSNQFLFGNNYGYAVTNKGLLRINPQTGKSVNLMEEDGDSKSYRIKQYFDSWDKQFATIGYSPREEMVIISLLKGVSDSNDVCICYHEPTKNFYIKKSFYGSFGAVNRDLYAGSSVDGKLFKLFVKGNYSDGYSSPQTMRVISEWDAVSSMKNVTLPLDFFTFFNSRANQPVTLNIYVDGNTSTPIATFNHTPEDKEDTGSLLSEFGGYILGVGRSDGISNSSYYSKDEFNQPFHSYCWELIETSSQNLEIIESVLEYTTIQEISESKSFATSLFNV